MMTIGMNWITWNSFFASSEKKMPMVTPSSTVTSMGTSAGARPPTVLMPSTHVEKTMRNPPCTLPSTKKARR